jgi:polyisoprenoid-binding protein YceI
LANSLDEVNIMFKSSRLVKPSILVAALFVVAQASAAWVAQGQRSASFTALGPGGLTIVGTGPDVSVTEKGDSLAISVGLATLKTGIDMRDRHMREKYLETSKYPNAVFQVDKSKLKLPSSGANVEGSLTLHGVTKQVNVHYVASGSAKELTVSGSMHINMKDFGVNVPSYLGVTVKPDVDVTVKFGAVDK